MGSEIRALRESEMQEHAELVYASYHPDDEYRDAPEEKRLWWLTSVRADPYWDLDQTRVCVLDGRLVSTVTNFRRDMACAGRVARTSAIGSVATHPDFRGRGLARLVLADSIAWMEAEDLDFSLLFGKYEVYGGSGWELLTALESYLIAQPHPGETGLTVRPADWSRDVPALAALHEGFCAPLTGPFLRTLPYWTNWIPGGYFHDRSVEFHVVEQDGDPVGYFRRNENHIPELAWRRDDPTLPARLLGALAREVALRRVEGEGAAPDEIRLGLASRELLEAARPLLLCESGRGWPAYRAQLRLAETYRGLWRYVGPGRGEFPEITDTASMLAFLREHEYCFWGGVDSF
jgi:GNAT superfamily N-acetyltransferase